MRTAAVAAVMGVLASLAAAPSPAAAVTPPLLFGVATTLTAGSLDRIDQIQARVQAPVGIVHWFQSFPQALLADRAKRVVASGRIPLVTWQPGVTGGGVTQPAYTLAKLADGTYDAYLREWGRALATVPGPVWLRFAPEMNGDWLPWSEGVNGNVRGSYVRAWRHVHDVVVAAGARNVLWLWCPNVPYVGTTPMAGMYPGDAYADLVGLDGYNFGTTKSTGWRTYRQVFDRGLAELAVITTRPVVIAEVGSVEQGGSKAAWVTDAFRAMNANSRIRAVVWFDVISAGRDFRIESSASSAQAFTTTLPTLTRLTRATTLSAPVRSGR